MSQSPGTWRQRVESVGELRTPSEDRWIAYEVAGPRGRPRPGPVPSLCPPSTTGLPREPRLLPPHHPKRCRGVSGWPAHTHAAVPPGAAPPGTLATGRRPVSPAAGARRSCRRPGEARENLRCVAVPLDDGSQETNSSGAVEPANTSWGSAAAELRLCPGRHSRGASMQVSGMPLPGHPAFTAVDQPLGCERLESGVLHDQPCLVPT